MTEEVFLTPEERLTQLSDSILSTILGKTKECKLLRQSVFSQIVPKVFRDENHIIYKVMYKFRDRGIVPDEEFLRMYLLRNENAILDSKGYIDIEAFSELAKHVAFFHHKRLIQFTLRNLSSKFFHSVKRINYPLLYISTKYTGTNQNNGSSQE